MVYSSCLNVCGKWDALIIRTVELVSYVKLNEVTRQRQIKQHNCTQEHSFFHGALGKYVSYHAMHTPVVEGGYVEEMCDVHGVSWPSHS